MAAKKNKLASHVRGLRKPKDKEIPEQRKRSSGTRSNPVLLGSEKPRTTNKSRKTQKGILVTNMKSSQNTCTRASVQ